MLINTLFAPTFIYCNIILPSTYSCWFYSSFILHQFTYLYRTSLGFLKKKTIQSDEHVTHCKSFLQFGRDSSIFLAPVNMRTVFIRYTNVSITFKDSVSFCYCKSIKVCDWFNFEKKTQKNPTQLVCIQSKNSPLFC